MSVHTSARESNLQLDVGLEPQVRQTRNQHSDSASWPITEEAAITITGRAPRPRPSPPPPTSTSTPVARIYRSAQHMLLLSSICLIALYALIHFIPTSPLSSFVAAPAHAHADMSRSTATHLTRHLLSDLHAYWYKSCTRSNDAPLAPEVFKSWFMQSDETDRFCRCVIVVPVMPGVLFVDPLVDGRATKGKYAADGSSDQYLPALKDAAGMTVDEIRGVAGGSADEELAAVILLDQIPRNVFRGMEAAKVGPWSRREKGQIGRTRVDGTGIHSVRPQGARSRPEVARGGVQRAIKVCVGAIQPPLAGISQRGYRYRC